MTNIFSNCIIPLSAVTVVLLLAVQLSTALEECYDDKKEKCDDVYKRELQDAGNRNYDAICKAIRKWIECYQDAFGCDEEMTRRWRLVRYWYFLFYNGTCDWSGVLEEVPPEFASGIAFGDPHYVMNGKDGARKVVTCNDAGEMLLAQGRRWSVKVNHKVIGANKGAVVDEVIVRVYPEVKGFALEPTGTPLREVKYTLSSLPEPSTTEGITIRADGLSTDWGLEVTAKRRQGYFEVGVSGPDMNNGILLNGCDNKGYATPTVNFGHNFSPMELSSFFLRRKQHAQSTNTVIPEKCKSVDKVFQEACAFDANQLNESWAVESASSAVTLAAEMKEKEKKSQKTANEKYDLKNGVFASTITQGSVLLLLVVVSMTVF